MRPAALDDHGEPTASEDALSTDYSKWRLFAIGYGLLWLVAIVGVFPVLHLDYDLLQTEFRRWSWAIFISPSAYVFFGALIDTVAAPVWMLLLVPAFFFKQSDGELNSMYKRRYAWTFLVIAGIFVIEIVNLTIMWGSFPLFVDALHYVHLKMIPFIPWPGGGFLVFP